MMMLPADCRQQAEAIAATLRLPAFQLEAHAASLRAQAMRAHVPQTGCWSHPESGSAPLPDPETPYTSHMA
jgi:hypothetical protein